MAQNEKKSWIDSDDPEEFTSGATRLAMKTSTKVIIYTVVAIIVLGVGGYLLNAALAGPKGAIDTHVREQSADNRISAQARFEDLYNDIKAQDDKLADAQQTLDDFVANTPVPADTDLVATQLYTQQLTAKQQVVTGIQNICHDLVADYNSEAEKILREDWRRDDLPQQIDSSAADTDCEADAA